LFRSSHYFAYLLNILFNYRKLKESVETKKAFAIPLRTLEVFTSPAWYAQMNHGNSEEYATTVSMYLAENGRYSYYSTLQHFSSLGFNHVVLSVLGGQVQKGKTIITSSPLYILTCV
jgi:hypothetical protein